MQAAMQRASTDLDQQRRSDRNHESKVSRRRRQKRVCERRGLAAALTRVCDVVCAGGDFEDGAVDGPSL